MPVWGGFTVVRKFGSSKGGVSSIRKVCQLMKRCDRDGGDVKVLWQV